jgi:hypothetical protein
MLNREQGACTPFVGNSPGLATHTEALVGLSLFLSISLIP